MIQMVMSAKERYKSGESGRECEVTAVALNRVAQGEDFT